MTEDAAAAVPMTKSVTGFPIPGPSFWQQQLQRVRGKRRAKVRRQRVAGSGISVRRGKHTSHSRLSVYVFVGMSICVSESVLHQNVKVGHLGGFVLLLLSKLS